MDEIEEMLPGLEEFLTITLASEHLSNFAEERRQYFIERLDIVKLPPTLPPREGRALPLELLKETEEVSGVLASNSTSDFAATQREISRSFVEPDTFTGDETDGPLTTSEKGVKLYDDINPTESAKEQPVSLNALPLSIIKSQTICDEEEDDDDEENALYEIPIAREHLSPDSSSQSNGADCSGIPAAGSTEELLDDVLDSTLVASTPEPPPLPPRRDIKFSDSGSRNSINLDDKPPELPFRPPLPKRNELYTRSDKSDRSEKSNNSEPELSGDGDSTSYESFDEEEQIDTELASKLSIQLPKKPVKKLTIKKSRKLSKSRSSSQWEISAPFRKLEDIDISGELYYRGKLKWNRRIVAISNGCLAMYKPEKDAKPSLVISLHGYEASVNEREGKKGFELRIVHPNTDSHIFSVDFKDWAFLWMEHINGISKGLSPPKYHTHLARTFSDVETSANTTSYGSKLNISADNSVDLEYDEINVSANVFNSDLFIKEEDDCDSIKSTPVESLSNPLGATFVSRHFQSEKSPRHNKRRTVGQSAKLNPFAMSSRDKTISASVKDILRRRQKAMYTIQSPEPCIQIERYTPKGDHYCSNEKPLDCKDEATLKTKTTAAALAVSRWGWKSVFYNWTLPLDQLMFAFRGTDLNESNSNLSTGSECVSEDSSRSRLKGNKVMRMGSFAYRATQFFENMGKKTTHKKKYQNSGPSFRHSGDFTDVKHGIIEEPSVSTSKSTGNLAKTMKTAVPDIKLASVHSCNSLSLPTVSISEVVGQHWEAMDVDGDFKDVIIKGYLFIFSSFNKRRWGKRWCQIRKNMFECYRTDLSKQCELHFLLKPCVLHKAIKETNSEHGLMIMEAGKEKITVEPLSKEDMIQWVQVLIKETSTKNFPEDLEAYCKDLQNDESNNSSELSFSVLRQWDMDCLVPSKNQSVHDYEDVQESSAPTHKVDPHKVKAPVQSSTESKNSQSCFKSQSISNSRDTVDKVNDSLSSIKNKHTTDSGFYSVQGTNSDSDSSHDVGDLEFAYAAHDSKCVYNSQQSTTLNQKFVLPFSGSKAERFIATDFSETETSFSHAHSKQHDAHSSSLQGIHLSHSLTTLPSSQCFNKLPTSASESHLTATFHTLDQHHRSGSDNMKTPSSSPANLNLSKIHSNSESLVSKADQSVSSSLTVLAPSGGEYSIVLKKSDKSSNFLDSSELASCSTMKKFVKQRCDDVNENNHCENEGCSLLENVSDEQINLITEWDNESSFYEPIYALNSVYNSNESEDRHSKIEEINKLCSSVTKIHNYDSDDCDQPPPIPTSPIPNLISSSQSSVKDLPSSFEEKDTLVFSLYVPKDTIIRSDTRVIAHFSTEKKNNNNKEVGDYAELSTTVKNRGTPNLEARAHNFCLSCKDSVSPTSDIVAALLNNPNATASELNDMIECLKHTQAEIKRKRMTVHDKQQMVLSDEERLACEKEFTALERAVESAELNIKTLQHQLDTLQGHTLATMKATQGKERSESKKRKLKKKPNPK